MDPRSVSPVAAQMRGAVAAAVALEVGRLDTWALAEPVDVDEFLRHADRHGVTSTLARSAVPFPHDLDVVLSNRAEVLGFRAMVLAKELHRATDALTSASIRVLALKGLALAAQTTGDFRARGAGDLDLLVSDADLDRAYEMLRHAGWHAREPEFPPDPQTWAWRHMRRTTFELVLVGERSSVDLHWRLDPARNALPDFEELWHRRAHVEVGGRLITTLGLKDAWRHSLRHAARDRWHSLQSLVDCRRLTTRIDRPPRLRAPEPRTLEVCAHLFDGAPTRGAARTAQRHLDVVDPRVVIVGTTLRRNTCDRLRGGLREVPRALLAAVLPYHAAAAVNDRRGSTGAARALFAYVRRVFRRGWIIG